ncbi:MAG: beta-ketoacyl-[acyl-carrier-protein] synthase family protein [Gammaproteobacteria bacterium]|nr:beta-ketoacyl-[acyl-carrier-protein] synthase family protein [Gammaproteobacteria bacterium]MBU1777263.1 beta-ketoacyl-[acyl-carrier-protein] synthase family protein [Gammaproteobacteria bacterium]MBU1968993.1 beta-ketoacyl-[acyl-carrier-protein] synthase family protein [Gammaproteobacteria bacterium]
MQPLVISRYTLANSLGLGSAATLEALRTRRSGLTPCVFEDVDLETYIAKVEALDAVRMRPDLSAYDCRNNRLAQLCLEQDGFLAATEAARQKYGAARIGVFMGTSTSGILQTELAYRHLDPQSGALPADFHYAETQNSYSLAGFVAHYLGLTGPSFVVSSACSSSAKVFANAVRMMAVGVCDAAVVGGVDSLCLSTLYGFNSLGLVSRSPCRPYDAERDGISIGEGAGFVLLERATAATSPEAMLLLGVGESSDAHHMSTPHPEGLGAIMAMQRALSAAGLQAHDIDYINLHGTATKSNDASEGKAVADVFGNKVACSSTKGWTGHLLGAAGISEAIIAMLAVEHGFIPGSVNTNRLDPAIVIDYRIENGTGEIKRVLSNSFGFGGSNCSLVLGKKS